MRLRLPLLFASLAAVSAQAWGPVGHRQVADIAWSQLTPTAKRAIARILMSGDTVTARGSDAIFFVPNQTITDEFLENAVRPIFDESANWCDAIKGGKSQRFDGRIVIDNVESPGVHPPRSGNAGEDTRCKTWHYYDKPITNKNDNAAHPARESNALRALYLRMAELEEQERHANPDAPSEAYCLYWIEHVFGDLHQPLHCVSDFRLVPTGDEGGNLFKLGIPSPYGGANNKWNLHGYWDSGIDHAIAEDPKLNSGSTPVQVTAQWLTESAFLPRAQDVANLDLVSWIDAGWQLAIDHVYKGIKPDGAPSAKYALDQAELCKRQALLAGFRLAAYLNRTFAKS